MKLLSRLTLLGVAFSVLAGVASAQGTWTRLPSQPPWAPSTLWLMTDGTILAQRDYPNGNNYAKLTPDANGSYLSGSWTTVASSTYTRLYFASGVFPDGRLIVSGGEYSNAGSEVNKTEIYDPVANQWTVISPPAGWTEVGDAPCHILPDGRFLLGSIADNRTAIFDPVSNTWSAGPAKDDSSSTEESWTLMPDNTLVADECLRHPRTEKYIFGQNRWMYTGNTINDLVLSSSFEVGASACLPNGKGFFVGGTPRTGLYTMGALPTDPGTWTAGPDIPSINGRMMGEEDGPGCLLPNGNFLFSVGPVTSGGGTYESPTHFFEYDFRSNLLIRAPDSANAGGVPYSGRMTILPTGETLLSQGGSIYYYVSPGSPDPSWKPSITSSPASVSPASTYTLQGRQLNGLSQCVGYGDDSTASTNYPIVRIRNLGTNHMFYCRSFGFSTMGIATGAAIVSCQFKVPSTIEFGVSEITVVANGISSDPTSISVGNIVAVPPTSFSVFRGVLESGGLSDLLVSDDSYLVVRNGATTLMSESPITVTFDTTSPNAIPASLDFMVENHVSITGLTQRIDMFDFTAGSYEQEDQRSATTTDSTVTAIGSNPGRFVESGTHTLRSRLRVRADGPVFVNTWRSFTDKVAWDVGS